ncbi:hypothetical protein EFN20_00815 [Propionibacterium freudenreichii]|nr:hypothetical protein BMR99_06425 [Propionibacterium freudenreichii]PWM94743.1 MAG: hypothetical protein DBX96_09040 [Propionibacterium sp.]MCT2974395.1 hypothetical protein [Propionibacterium freudenreichii]MCT2976482.1 hypothetical protein [Propionibacterium freudenreichii]MCT2977336.1 hypothetical protein [Propionibacterium freudenreichii]
MLPEQVPAKPDSSVSCQPVQARPDAVSLLRRSLGDVAVRVVVEAGRVVTFGVAEWEALAVVGVLELGVDAGVLPSLDPQAVSSNGAAATRARIRWACFMSGVLRVGGY